MTSYVSFSFDKNNRFCEMGFFSVPLLTLASKTSRVIPKFLEKCLRFLLKKENLVKGVFKNPPNYRELNRMIKLIDASGDVTFTDQTNPETVSHIILQFLDKIPNHILVDDNAGKWDGIPLDEKDGKATYVHIRHFVKKLPKANHLLLSRIIAFFKIYCSKASKTDLTVEACSEILAPLLIVNPTEKQWILDPQIVRIMIHSYKKIFTTYVAIETKTSLKRSSKYEEEYMKELSQEFYSAQTMRGIAPNLQQNQIEVPDNKKMCRNVQIQTPNWDRILHNMLARERRYHAPTTTSWFDTK